MRQTAKSGEIPEYQILLQQELRDRRRINAKYSARSMARDLDLSAPFLSQLLSGKRLLSDQGAERIARQLKWTSGKRRAFTLLAQIARTKSPELRDVLSREYWKLNVPVRSRSGFRRLKLDVFNLISDWQHYAVLELTELKSFKAEISWIAKSLGISVERAKSSVERLTRVGLLSSDLRKTEVDYRIGDIPSQAIRNFHRQMLKLAERALTAQSPGERDFSGCTIAVDPARLPQIRELIRNFQKELIEVANAGEKTAVYQLSTQLFRLNQAPENPKK